MRGGAGGRAPQLIIVLAAAFLALLLGLSMLPEPPPEQALPPAPTQPPAPTGTPEPTPKVLVMETENDDVQMSIQIDEKDREAIVGDIVGASIWITNISQEKLYVAGYWLSLIDEYGTSAEDRLFRLPSGSYGSSISEPLQPGERLPLTTLARMPLEVAGEQDYELWGTFVYTLSARDAEQHWFQAGGLPMRVSAGPPELKLSPTISTDVNGWTVSVSDASGAQLKAPATVLVTIETDQSHTYEVVEQQTSEGSAQGRWIDLYFQAGDELPVRVHALVTAPGYVTGKSSQVVDLARDEAQHIPARISETETFDQLSAAQSRYGKRALSIPNGSLGLRFDHAQVSVLRGYTDGTRWERRGISQRYHTDEGGVVILEQHQQAWAVDLRLRIFRGEQITIGARSDYVLSTQNGWWRVSWDQEEQTISLRAREDLLSRAELLEIVPLVE